MNAAEMLNKLRENGEIALKNCDYIVRPTGMFANNTENNHIKTGGSANLIGHSKQIASGKYEGVCRITVESNDQGTDYYFPWVNRGVGYVTVPSDSANGTIVLTGGMNGCALEVREDEGLLTFYHDGDNCKLDELLPARSGTCVCRVEPKDYDKLNAGRNATEKYPKMNGYSWLHQLVCVKHDGKWKVLYSSLIKAPGDLEYDIKATFTAGVSKFLTSF